MFKKNRACLVHRIKVFAFNNSLRLDRWAHQTEVVGS